ncbi:hypothetical protein MPTK1_2g22730 [Marchantia polymorpha subsp. ruderalis]|uniref:Uncharacterized protein n=2 Tax=Marchantia polymorpha TaxID=3197 RepID=A0A176VIR1_MARPO|nr:hypothetical protein AXG93_2964s1150 [Marchantia polymorpha subsp. ruderalis]PTQ35315.1 hypothetical protein MARPO_0072s0058 [Marchantia polymorpha]BBN03336.1 hypothetical protein Mp_2g22730 [Marchantia polymorpha subsp. ruderalis]|eukprot:PTQ35315.1 hypothetical protein MARPO_0072s0058 [Marchantia polymorpha]
MTVLSNEAERIPSAWEVVGGRAPQAAPAQSSDAAVGRAEHGRAGEGRGGEGRSEGKKRMCERTIDWSHRSEGSEQSRGPAEGMVTWAASDTWRTTIVPFSVHAVDAPVAGVGQAQSAQRLLSRSRACTERRWRPAEPLGSCSIARYDVPAFPSTGYHRQLLPEPPSPSLLCPSSMLLPKLRVIFCACEVHTNKKPKRYGKF